MLYIIIQYSIVWTWCNLVSETDGATWYLKQMLCLPVTTKWNCTLKSTEGAFGFEQRTLTNADAALIHSQACNCCHHYWLPWTGEVIPCSAAILVLSSVVNDIWKLAASCIQPSIGHLILCFVEFWKCLLQFATDSVCVCTPSYHLRIYFESTCRWTHKSVWHDDGGLHIRIQYLKANHPSILKTSELHKRLQKVSKAQPNFPHDALANSRAKQYLFMLLLRLISASFSFKFNCSFCMACSNSTICQHSIPQISKSELHYQLFTSGLSSGHGITSSWVMALVRLAIPSADNPIELGQHIAVVSFLAPSAVSQGFLLDVVLHLSELWLSYDLLYHQQTILLNLDNTSLWCRFLLHQLYLTAHKQQICSLLFHHAYAIHQNLHLSPTSASLLLQLSSPMPEPTSWPPLPFTTPWLPQFPLSVCGRSYRDVAVPLCCSPSVVWGFWWTVFLLAASFTDGISVSRSLTGADLSPLGVIIGGTKLCMSWLDRTSDALPTFNAALREGPNPCSWPLMHYTSMWGSSLQDSEVPMARAWSDMDLQWTHLALWSWWVSLSISRIRE